MEPVILCVHQVTRTAPFGQQRRMMALVLRDLADQRWLNSSAWAKSSNANARESRLIPSTSTRSQTGDLRPKLVDLLVGDGWRIPAAGDALHPGQRVHRFRRLRRARPAA